MFRTAVPVIFAALALTACVSLEDAERAAALCQSFKEKENETSLSISSRRFNCNSVPRGTTAAVAQAVAQQPCTGPSFQSSNFGLVTRGFGISTSGANYNPGCADYYGGGGSYYNGVPALYNQPRMCSLRRACPWGF